MWQSRGGTPRQGLGILRAGCGVWRVARGDASLSNGVFVIEGSPCQALKSRPNRGSTRPAADRPNPQAQACAVAPVVPGRSGLGQPPSWVCEKVELIYLERI